MHKLDAYDFDDMLAKLRQDVSTVRDRLGTDNQAIAELERKLTETATFVKLLLTHPEANVLQERKDILLVVLSMSVRLMASLYEIEQYSGPEGFDRNLTEGLEVLNAMVKMDKT